MPFRQYAPGKVGIVSKPGTLSYEAIGAPIREELGQSLVTGMGSDMLPGTTLADVLACFYDYEPTESIVTVREIGGRCTTFTGPNARTWQHVVQCRCQGAQSLHYYFQWRGH
jgi:succinyl-CoA synthetase alpha subunit